MVLHSFIHSPRLYNKNSPPKNTDLKKEIYQKNHNNHLQNF